MKMEKKNERETVHTRDNKYCGGRGTGGDEEERKEKTRANEKFRIAVNFVRRRHNETAVVNCEHFISKNLNFKRAVLRVLAE